ncbi:MAG: hypothetical protein ABH828_05385 [archaeon]
MIFDEGKTWMKVGHRLGFLIAYFLFTTILFMIFLLLSKMPEGWNYFHIMGITAVIAIIGAILRRLLK